MEITRECKTCGEVKPIDDFQKKRVVTSTQGEKEYRIRQCNTCRSKHRREKGETLSKYCKIHAQMIIAGHKYCSKCGEFKPIGEYNKRISNLTGLNSQCRVCDRESKKQSRINNPEVTKRGDKIRGERYRKLHPERVKRAAKVIRDKYQNTDLYKSKRREYLAEHVEQTRITRNKYQSGEKYRAYVRRKRDELSDCYIKSLLTSNESPLTAKDIPQSLIDVKREELRIRRIIKQMEKSYAKCS